MFKADTLIELICENLISVINGMNYRINNLVIRTINETILLKIF